MRRTVSRLRPAASILAICAFGFLLVSCGQKSNDPAGIWKGRIKTNAGEQVAFTLEVKKEGDRIVGSLINGDDRTTSTSGVFDGKNLRLKYDFYDGELDATIEGDRLQGVFTRQWQKKTLNRQLTAERAPASSIKIVKPVTPGVDLTGDWVLKVGDAPNQRLWRAAFKQDGHEVTGTIIPVSGDWGLIVGTLENGQLTLNRFDGINCRVFKAKLTADGKLEGFVDLGLFDPKRNVVAERLDAINKDSIAGLPDPSNYARMNNPAEPLRFNFPDLNGKNLSSTDPRFKDKVVIVSITGSWCPNCYEEAPFVQELYDRYREQGLEAVALAFEYTGDPGRDMEQVRIFANRNKITFPMLLAGSTEEGDLQKKLPQLVNFGGYPTTIFIGRDGLVKRIHTGFEGKATGERFTRLKAEYEELIKELLADTAS